LPDIGDPVAELVRYPMFDALTAHGRISLIILVALAVEVAAIAWWRARKGKGPRLIEIAGTTFSGVCFALALYAALTGLGSAFVIGFVMLSLVGHLHDLARRGPWL
jgi:hypothetical protein